MSISKPENLKELFTYRLNRLANVSSALAARTIEDRYELQPRDWRIIAMLAVSAPMSIKTLAREIHVDKSQASRDVTDLISRGLIARDADVQDGRGVQLSLTAQGRALYRKVFPKAVERNEKLLSVLSDAEREVVERAMQVLTEHAMKLLNESKESAPKTRSRKNAQAMEASV
jgi:DNA-binding MarR family transcriptional regulator